LGELEYQVRREILVALQETDEIGEKFLVHQGVRRDMLSIAVIRPALSASAMYCSGRIIAPSPVRSREKHS
jgi:hypothetical protein